MKKIFRKAITVLGSVALIGATIGAAAAAAYPAPFTSNTAIIVGANAAPSDTINGASLIATDLDAAAVSGVGGGAVTGTTGDIISLDTGSTRIFLNTSLNTAKSIITKSDLPVVLADTTFSGNVDAKLTSTITMLSGAAAGAGGSNKVIFERQPGSSDEPVIGVNMGSSAQPLYNVSFTSKAINFTHADSEGESITLFGRDFVVSTATSATSLVLFSSASELNLVAGGANANPTATVVIDGTSYDVELITGTSSSATIAINGDSKEITEGSSKKVSGVDVAVKSVTESTALDTVTASILVGANKLTFTDNQAITQGSDDETIDGTKAYITGGIDGVTKLTVSVFRPSTSDDAILPGQAFVDPVFGSFKVDFAGMNIPLDDSDRSTIKVASSGDKGIELTMTDYNNNEKSFIFAYNNSGLSFLGDTNNDTIGVMEMANMSKNTGVGTDRFIVLGNEESGKLMELTTLTNSSSTDHTLDKVRLTSVFDSSDYADAVFTAEGNGTINIGGKSYDVIFSGGANEEALYVQFRYPNGDSADDDTFIVYPTIKTDSGALVALYEPLTFTLGNADGHGVSTSTTLRFPDGDGYTNVVATYKGLVNAVDGGWLVGSAAFNATAVGSNSTTFTIGKLTYKLEATGTVNQTTLKVTNPEATGTSYSAPGLIIFEEKDDAGDYNAIVVSTEENPAGSGTSGYGFGDVTFSSTTMYEKTMKDSDFTQNVDLFGVLATIDGDDSDQKTLTLSFPDNQIYAQLFVGETDATVSGGASSSAGVMTVMDTAVASVAGKNLVVVGGSAINAVAAELLGGAFSEAAFTTATGVGAGEFLIQSFSRAGKTALLVAGYNAADTEKAVTALLNSASVDTTVGKKYVSQSTTVSSTDLVAA